MKSGKQIEKPRLNRRPPFYNTRIYPDIELSGDAYEKAYKRYKKICYGYLVFKSLLFFLLGVFLSFLLKQL